VVPALFSVLDFVVKNSTTSVVTLADAGSFDCGRLTPHYAQDDT
jgi:hypothetical protein